MARIIEAHAGVRRLIRMSTEDIISIVRDYQRIVPRGADSDSIRDFLNDTVIFVPEDV